MEYDSDEYTDPDLWADPTGERRQAAIARTARNSRFTVEELARMPLWALSEDFLPSIPVPVSESTASADTLPKDSVPGDQMNVQSSEHRAPSQPEVVEVASRSMTALVNPRPLSSSRIPGPPSTSRIPDASESQLNVAPPSESSATAMEIFLQPNSMVEMTQQIQKPILEKSIGPVNEDGSNSGVSLGGSRSSEDVWLDAESMMLVPEPSCETGINEVCISDIDLYDTSPSDSESEEKDSTHGNVLDTGSKSSVPCKEPLPASSTELPVSVSEIEPPIQPSVHELSSTEQNVPISTTDESSIPSPKNPTSADAESLQGSWLDVLSVDWWLNNNTSTDSPTSSDAPQDPCPETENQLLKSINESTPKIPAKSSVNLLTERPEPTPQVETSSDSATVSASLNEAISKSSTALAISGLLRKSSRFQSRSSVTQTAASSRLHQPASSTQAVSLPAPEPGTNDLDQEDMLNNNTDWDWDYSPAMEPRDLPRTGLIDSKAMMFFDEAESNLTQAPEAEGEADYDSDEHEHVFGVEEYDAESAFSSVAEIETASPEPETSYETQNNTRNSEREIILASRRLRRLDEPQPFHPRPTFRMKEQEVCDSAHDHLRSDRGNRELAKECISEPVSLAAQYITNEAKTAAEAEVNRAGSPHGSEITLCSGQSGSSIGHSSDESVVPLTFISDPGSKTGFNVPVGSQLSAVFLTKPPVNFPNDSKLSVNNLVNMVDFPEHTAVVRAQLPETTTSSSNAVQVSMTSLVQPGSENEDEAEFSTSDVEPSPSEILISSSTSASSMQSSTGSFKTSVEMPKTQVESPDLSQQWSESEFSIKHQTSDLLSPQNSPEPNLESDQSIEIISSYRKPRKQAHPQHRLSPLNTSDLKNHKWQYQASFRHKLRAMPLRKEEPVYEFYDAEPGEDSEFVNYVQLTNEITKMIPFPFSVGRDDEQTLIHVDLPYVVECYYEDMSFYVRIVLTSMVNQAVTYKMIPSNEQRWKIKPSDAMGVIMPGMKKLVYAYTIADYPLAYTDLVHDTFQLCSTPFFYQVAPGQDPNVTRDVDSFWEPNSDSPELVVEKIRLGCNRPLLTKWFDEKQKVPDYIRSFEWKRISWDSPKAEPLNLKPLLNLDCSTGDNAFQKDVLCGKLLNTHLIALRDHSNFTTAACVSSSMLVMMILGLMYYCVKTYFVPEPQSSSFLSWLPPWCYM